MPPKPRVPMRNLLKTPWKPRVPAQNFLPEAPPKPRVPTRIFFPNIRMFLKLRPDPKVDPKTLLPDDTFETETLVVQTEPRMTKPEIRQYLEKMYNLEITKVHTLNVMHKRKRVGNFRKKTKEYKKAYVELSSPVTLPMRPRPHADFVKDE